MPSRRNAGSTSSTAGPTRRAAPTYAVGEAAQECGKTASELVEDGSMLSTTP